MIKNYDPNFEETIHTVRITLMQRNYVGHISRMIKSNGKGAFLLTADFFDFDAQEDIDRYVENDCEFSYDENYDVYRAVLTNPNGEVLEVEGNAYEMKDMVVSIEFIDVMEVITE